MTITQVYAHYKIPPNLVRHQIEVAAVGRCIATHWSGSTIDKQLLTKALLLHDMGNIIKFKRPFLGQLEKQSAYWEQVQQQFIQLYGPDVHTATITIVQELQLADVVEVINAMKQVWTHGGDAISDLARIAEYADCCVTPDGIVGFSMRLQDLKTRYFSAQSTEVIDNMKRNAAYIQKYVDIDLESLQTLDFSKDMAALSDFVI